MKSIVQFEILYAVLLLIIQFLLLSFLMVMAMRKFGLIKYPIAGLEYSQGIFVSFILLGGYIIGLASILNVFDTVKAIQHAGQPVYVEGLIKFAQFFLVILVLETLYWLLILFSAKLFVGFKKPFEEIANGNIPASCLMAAMSIGYALLLKLAAKEMLELITPKFFAIN